jgi:hypothetical protein
MGIHIRVQIDHDRGGIQKHEHGFRSVIPRGGDGKYRPNNALLLAVQRNDLLTTHVNGDMRPIGHGCGVCTTIRPHPARVASAVSGEQSDRSGCGVCTTVRPHPEAVSAQQEPDHTQHRARGCGVPPLPIRSGLVFCLSPPTYSNWRLARTSLSGGSPGCHTGTYARGRANRKSDHTLPRLLTLGPAGGAGLGARKAKNLRISRRVGYATEVSQPVRSTSSSSQHMSPAAVVPVCTWHRKGGAGRDGRNCRSAPDD